MTCIQRKIGGYIGQFTFKQHELLINVLHPNKSQMLFCRITNDIFPPALSEIADNIHELVSVIEEISDDKIAISPNNELVLIMSIGKKTKQYAIPLEKADMSSEDSLKKKVDELQKKLEQKSFEAAFFKDQYQFLLKHLQLKPNIEQLQKLYAKGNLSELFFNQKELKDSKLTSSSSKVGSGIRIKNQCKCPNNHQMEKISNTPPKSYKCNVCRKLIEGGTERATCGQCQFDVCQKCLNIPPQHRKYCPLLHALQFGCSNFYNLRLCDHCQKSLASSKGFSCIQCDYDVCKECI